MQGKVKWYDNGRGFGVIETEKGEEVIFTRVAVENAGRISQRAKEAVEFDIKKVPRGKEAANLHVLS